MDAIIQAFANEAQELEDAMWNLLESRLLTSNNFYNFGRALFSGSDTASLFWIRSFTDTSYLMLPGKAVVTDGAGPVLVSIDNTSKTKGGVKVMASSLFFGYVDVLAWEPDADPVPTGGIGGDLLDKIGKIVGQPRNGMADPEYLILITARIVANRSDGKRETLIKLAKLLVPGASIYVKDFPPCSVYVAPQAPVPVDPYVAGQFMTVAKAAGVELVFAWSASPVANTIVGGDVYAPGFSAGPAPTNTGALSTQFPGDIYNSGFSAGPPCINDGGGFLAEAIQG